MMTRQLASNASLANLNLIARHLMASYHPLMGPVAQPNNQLLFNSASLYNTTGSATGGNDHRSSSIAALRRKAREHSVALGTMWVSKV